MSFEPRAMANVLALYHLADVNDSSGNSHTLTNGGTVTFGLGKLGNCALFGNANSSKYLLHSDGLGKDLSGAASFSVWFVLQTLPASGESQTIIRWGNTTGTPYYFYLNYINDSGTKKLRVVCGEGGAYIDLAINLSVTVWYKADVNIDSTCELFLNGASVGTNARGASGGSYANIAIGARYTTLSDQYFKGNIDEAIFFSSARTAADIRRRYAFERGMLM